MTKIVITYIQSLDFNFFANIGILQLCGNWLRCTVYSHLLSKTAGNGGNPGRQEWKTKWI